MSSAAIRVASALPSSTPHWSNESIPQIVPWTNTLCSYSATSDPSIRGVRRFTRITDVGRLPSNTRAATWWAGTPSAITCSRVLPNANASACANRLAISRSWWSPTSVVGLMKPMRSAGTIRVPWWSSW